MIFIRQASPLVGEGTHSCMCTRSAEQYCLPHTPQGTLEAGAAMARNAPRRVLYARTRSSYRPQRKQPQGRQKNREPPTSAVSTGNLKAPFHKGDCAQHGGFCCVAVTEQTFV